MRVMEGHTYSVWSVDWDSACKTAVSGSDDTTIKQWDLGSGRCVETYQCDAATNQVFMHELGSSFLSRHVSASSQELKTWAACCGTPLMTVPLLGCKYWLRLAANSDLSYVALCAESEAGFKVEVWK